MGSFNDKYEVKSHGGTQEGGKPVTEVWKTFFWCLGPNYQVPCQEVVRSPFLGPIQMETGCYKNNPGRGWGRGGSAWSHSAFQLRLHESAVLIVWGLFPSSTAGLCHSCRCTSSEVPQSEGQEVWGPGVLSSRATSQSPGSCWWGNVRVSLQVHGDGSPAGSASAWSWVFNRGHPFLLLPPNP